MSNLFWNNLKDFLKKIKIKKTFGYMSSHAFWFKCSFCPNQVIPDQIGYLNIWCLTLSHVISFTLLWDWYCHLPGLTDTVVKIQWNYLWKLFRKQKLHLQWVWNIIDTEYVYTCIQWYAYLYWIFYQFCYHSCFFSC